MKKKIDDWVNKKWKDPVWSKVIANALWYGPIAAIGAFLLKMWKSINPGAFFRFWELLLGVFTYKIKLSLPVWGMLVSLGLVAAVIWVIRRIAISMKQRTIEDVVSPIWDEKVGARTFYQLYTTLHGRKVLEKTKRMRDLQIGPPNLTLLELFGGNRDRFNAGLKNTVAMYGDGGYMLDLIAPILLEYGLLVKHEEEAGSRASITKFITYETSTDGYKFLDYWDKLSAEQHVQ